MKKVEQIKLHNARNSEHYDFMAIVAATFNQSVATTLNLTPLYDALHALFLQEDAAMKISHSSERTPDIQQFEKERTKLYRFLHQTIEMSAKLPDQHRCRCPTQPHGNRRTTKNQKPTLHRILHGTHQRKGTEKIVL